MGASWPIISRRRRCRIELLILQPTPFCNLDCDYCYLPGRDDRSRMSDATLERSLARVFESRLLGDALTIVWHAGEPLVLPPTFYARAFAMAEAMRPPQLTLMHSFQTNATLIDARWASFLGDRRVQVGVSLDGPRHLHDARRRTRSGRGTFDQTMRGVRVLQDAGIPFHVITVLSAASLREPEALFDFFVANGIRHVGFNYDEQEGVNARSSMHGAENEEAYRNFLRRFLSLARSVPPETLVVREFAGAFAEIVNPPRRSADNHQVEPFRILCVDANGQASTFSPELLGTRNARYGDFIIGNVHRDTLETMADSAVLLLMEREIAAGVRACRRDCGYFRFCGGGAPANKLFETGRFDTTETLYCRLTKKAVIDTVLEELELTLGLAKAGGTNLPMELPHGSA